MLSKGQIVKIGGKTYRLGNYINGSIISIYDGLNSAKEYHIVEDSFPYNDIEGMKDNNSIILDDSDVKGSLVCIFPEPGSKEFNHFIKGQIKTSAEFRSRLFNEWVKIDSMEYKLSYAYAGERINILYREPGDMGPIYNILYTDDYDSYF
jgi:hypothetical protein